METNTDSDGPELDLHPDAIKEEDTNPNSQLEAEEEPQLSQVPDGSALGEESGDKTVMVDKIVTRTVNYVVYQATIKYANGTPFADKPINLDVENDYNYYRTTDSKGTASLTIYYLKNGNYKVTAYSEDYNVSHTSSFKVFPVLKSCKLSSCYYDDGTYYKARVYDNDGKPLKGAKVVFNVGKKKYTRISDKNGYAKLKITFKPGKYTIKTTYNKYAIRKDITVKNPLKVLTKFNGKLLKSKFKFKVKFLGNHKKNRKITVKFNKKTYKAKTNKKGIATFKIKSPRSLSSYNPKIVVKYKNARQYRVLGWTIAPPKVYFYLSEPY